MDEIELMQFRSCPSCGCENDEDEQTCVRCGVALDEYDPSTPEPGSAPSRPAAPAQTAHSRPSRARSASADPSGKLPLKPILFAVVAAGIAYFALTSKPYELVGATPTTNGEAVVLMHGFGAPGDDLVPRAEELSGRLPNVTFLVLEAPHSRVMGRAWVRGGTLEDARDQAQESRARVLDAVADLEDEGIASGDIYLGGFSQGSQMALDVAGGEDAGRKLGGLILMSGGWPNWPGSVSSGDAEFGNLAADARVLVTHGRSDSVVSHGSGESVADSLRESANVEFVEFDGGHTISPAVVDAVVAFLSAD